MDRRNMAGEPGIDRGTERDSIASERPRVQSGVPGDAPEPMESAPAVAERRPETANRPPGGNAAENAATAARHAADDAADRARQTISQAGERASDLADAAAERARNLKGAAAEKLSGAGQAVADRAASFREGAAEVLDDAGGPAPVLGSILGALAGALGGWWAGARLGTTSGIPEEEEQACQAHFVSIAPQHAELSYEIARPGYLLGYYAARNPSYRGRSFDDIEPDLRQGFTGTHADRYGTLRDFTRFGYERGTSGGAVGSR